MRVGQRTYDVVLPARRRRRPMRRVVAVIAAVLVLANVGLIVARAPVRRLASRLVPATPERAALESVSRFFRSYVSSDGRVVRRDQGGDTVSEGQAYAMLLSAAAGDRARFEAVWGWTKSHLQRADGLMSWRFADGAIVDPQPASDADLDASRALLLAADRFERPAYRADGLRIAGAVLRTQILRAPSGEPLLAPGPWAVEQRVLNPSYNSPRAMEAIVDASSDTTWDAVRAAGYHMVETLTRSPAQLPPDWATLDDSGRVLPSADPGDAESRSRFGYEAARLPIRFAEDCDPEGLRLAAGLWPQLRGEPDGYLRTLDGDPLPERHAIALVASSAAALASGEHAESKRLLERAERLDRRQPTYYGSAWVALGRVMLQTHMLGGCA